MSRFQPLALCLPPALLFAALAAGLWLDPGPIAFQSEESTTRSGGPVYNEIRYIPGSAQDVWMMRQSHGGPDLPRLAWDRLAIVIDKTRFPRKALFYQLEPGPLEWTAQARHRPFRVSCFQCHTNGPRAIRPAAFSAAMTPRAWDRARIALWNLRIRSYLRTRGEAAWPGSMPFRLSGRFENETLAVMACARCHNESRWGRGALTRQNASAIGFMVHHGQMPPPGFSLGAKERRDVENFLRLL